MSTTATKCAIWARVSTEDQRAETQTAELRAWAEREGYEVVKVIQFEDSAWASSNGGKGTQFDRKRAELLEGARLKHYTVVLTWGLDRLSRRGPEDMFTFIRMLTAPAPGGAGATLRSKNDPWVESVRDPFAQSILLGIFATVAEFESARRSARIRVGIARKRAAGEKHGGRKPGAKDKRKREHKTGAAAGWTEERKAQLALRNQQRTAARNLEQS